MHSERRGDYEALEACRRRIDAHQNKTASRRDRKSIPMGFAANPSTFGSVNPSERELDLLFLPVDEEDVDPALPVHLVWDLGFRCGV